MPEEGFLLRKPCNVLLWISSLTISLYTPSPLLPPTTVVKEDLQMLPPLLSTFVFRLFIVQFIVVFSPIFVCFNFPYVVAESIRISVKVSYSNFIQ